MTTEDRSLGLLLIAGVALVACGDLGPELSPLLIGGGAGDHGPRRAGDGDPDLWVSVEVAVPRRLPVIATGGGHQHQPAVLDDGRCEHSRALLARTASGGDQLRDRQADNRAEKPPLRIPEDQSMDPGGHLEKDVL